MIDNSEFDLLLIIITQMIYLSDHAQRHVELSQTKMSDSSKEETHRVFKALMNGTKFSID
jgi:hypothetical protein